MTLMCTLFVLFIIVIYTFNFITYNTDYTIHPVLSDLLVTFKYLHIKIK